MVSVFRCDMHGKRIPGSLESAYFNVLRRGTRYSRRLRLCPDCLDQLLRTFVANGSPLQDYDSDVDESVCATCGEEHSPNTVADFVRLTYFRRKSEQQAVLGTLCEGCSSDAITKLGLVES